MGVNSVVLSKGEQVATKSSHGAISYSTFSWRAISHLETLRLPTMSLFIVASHATLKSLFPATDGLVSVVA